MDNELKGLAMLVLKNAFYSDFSTLVNEYLKAAQGVDDGTFALQLGEAANVFSRNTEEGGDFFLNIWTQNRSGTTGHGTIFEALEFDQASRVYIQGRLAFERRNGEMYFVGDEGDSQ
jgi:hypothetical protein